VKENGISSSSNVQQPKQTKGAVTLTFAAVVLFSGLWALWYTPPSTYDMRKSEQISYTEIVVKPNNPGGTTFNVDSSVKEIGITISGQLVAIQNPNPPPAQNNNNQAPPPDIPPVFSAKVTDPQDKVIRTYDNVTSAGDGDKISVQQPGTFKVEVFDDSSPNAIRIQLRATDITKIPNHPLDGMGQWLTIISLPIFGLAAWFVLSRSRRHSKLL